MTAMLEVQHKGICYLFYCRIQPAWVAEARFKRRILHAPNAIQTMHNEEAYLIIYCLNCIRCMQNSTFETGLTLSATFPEIDCKLRAVHMSRASPANRADLSHENLYFSRT